MHVVQLVLGYFLMLMAMSYHIPVFLAVISGPPAIPLSSRSSHFHLRPFYSSASAASAFLVVVLLLLCHSC